MKEINLHFFILFFLAIQVFISDIIIYCFDTNFLFTNIISGIFFILIFIFLYKKEKIKLKLDFNKIDLVFIIPYFIYIIFSIVFPDLSWDTRSYHIYLQENNFISKINFDFFAGRNLNSFLFSLGDRINYLFRICLGYRLGTIISYYLIIVLFYQIKNFLNNIVTKFTTNFITIMSGLIVISSIIFSYTGTYYIDNFSLIFLIEIFFIVFFENNIVKDKIKLYTLSILIGIAISIKVTNIIFLIPLGIYFLITNFKEIKNLKIYNYMFIFLMLVIPWGVYALDNYIQTGNPVFPYYNNFFKSEYFMNEEWEDKNFGPKNLKQFLFWPIYIVFNPSCAFDTKFVDITWGFGYICVIIYFIYTCKNRNFKNNKLFYLNIIIFISYYLWAKFLIGYVRYAAILLVLSLIVMVNILEIVYIKYKKSAIIFICVFIIITLPSMAYDFLVKIKDFNSVSEFIFEYKSNCSRIIKDRKTDKIDSNEVFGAIGDDSLLVTLLRKDNKIYNLEEWVTITNNKTKQLYEEKIDNNIILVPVDKKTQNIKEDYLNRNNFEILEIETLKGDYNFLSSSDELLLYKVKKIK